MTITLIILSCVLWILSIAVLARRIMAAPALSFVALTLLSLAKNSYGYPLLPINNTILIGWLCMTVMVMLVTMLQPDPVIRQTRGTGYIIAGALTGLAVGLLGFTFSENLPLLYAIMVTGTVAGTFFGFLIYSRTPDGRAVNISSGNFFKYLLAKGFPTAITVMMPGVALVLLLAVKHIS